MVERATVLVVDDEPDILVTLAAYLEGALNVDVKMAATGVEGLEVMAQWPLDLIISDFRMPGMNGVEFLTKAREQAPDVPRILLTAFPDMQLAIKAVNDASILSFLTKPVRPEQLRALVEKALDESRRKRLGQQALQGAAKRARPKP